MIILRLYRCPYRRSLRGRLHLLCDYVTPAEHLRLPNAKDVHEGVIATRLACHAADIVKKVPGAWEWDLKMAKARKALDWKE